MYVYYTLAHATGCNIQATEEALDTYCSTTSGCTVEANNFFVDACGIAISDICEFMYGKCLIILNLMSTLIPRLLSRSSNIVTLYYLVRNNLLTMKARQYIIQKGFNPFLFQL